MNPVDNQEFFNSIFEGLEGYLCIVTIDRKRANKTEQHFYRYPDDLEKAVEFIRKNRVKFDIYFAPFLTLRRRRRKEDIAETPVIWADGDTCPIEELVFKPTHAIRTSKGRHSFLWKFEEVQSPEIGEEISKRVAYFHAEKGMDRSGWDLTQLLRVPDSYNHKYDPSQQIPLAGVADDVSYTPQEFYEVYPEVEYQDYDLDFSNAEIPEKSADEILEQYKHELNPRAFALFNEVPRQDWSKAMWNLELMLLEAGMKPGEAFVVAREAACNKARRDKRPDSFVWREVQRASGHIAEREAQPPAVDPDKMVVDPPKLLTDEERASVAADRTFVEEYVDWAKSLGDAAVQYHPAGAMVILSALMSGSVSLPTSFGTLIPNLWFMILADTTLTRKSTAMDNAIDLLLEVDYDALLATDGSVEGLMTAMSTRQGRPSLFLRDEVTGLIESLTKKDYLAGMMETLTKLYDGKTLKRILRRETIDVRDPVLILFAGGIKNKMMDLLDYQHVASGFLPRFVFVIAEADITRMKPIGPPTQKDLAGRTQLLKAMTRMKDHYSPDKPKRVGTSIRLPKRWIAELTPEAWHRYNTYEFAMLDFAMHSFDPTLLTPMMDRLAKSGLKAAVLIAASRIQEEKVLVTEQDILHAFFYVEQWQRHTAYIISNVGTSQDERKLQRILSMVESNPGITRGRVMQRHFLDARTTDNIFATLEQRGAIKRESAGRRSERLYPAHYALSDKGQ